MRISALAPAPPVTRSRHMCTENSSGTRRRMPVSTPLRPHLSTKSLTSGYLTQELLSRTSFMNRRKDSLNRASNVAARRMKADCSTFAPASASWRTWSLVLRSAPEYTRSGSPPGPDAPMAALLDTFRPISRTAASCWNWGVTWLCAGVSPLGTMV